MSTTNELIDKFKALNKKLRNFAQKLVDESETFPELLNQADIMGVPNISNIDETTSNEAINIYEDYTTLINKLKEHDFNNIVIADIGLIKNINERMEQLIFTIIMTKKNILDYLSFLEDDENDINLLNQGRKKKRKKIKRNKGTNKKGTNKKSNNKKRNNKKTKNRKYKKGKKYTEK